MCCTVAILLKKPHKPAPSDLRFVQQWMVNKIPSLTTELKICSSCRKALKDFPGSSTEVPLEEEFQVETYTEQSATVEMEESVIDDKLRDIALRCLNECLNSIGEEPFDKKRLKNQVYLRKKWEITSAKIAEKLFELKHKSKTSSETNQSNYVEKLKTSYKNTPDKKFREFILTLVPENWSVKRTAEEFEGSTPYIVKKSRKSDRTETQHGGHGGNLNSDTISLVKNFYRSDDISRIMPGKKDVVSIKVISNFNNKYFSPY